MLCLLALLSAAAQEAPQRKPEFSLSLIGGGTVPNSSKESYIRGSDFGLAAAVDWQSDGREYWERFWQKPTFGIQLEYLRSTNGIAGDRIAVAGEMRNVVWRSKSAADRPGYTHSVFWNIGAGAAVFTNPYERSKDTLNEFIGSYINCIFNLGAGYRVDFPDRSALSFGLRFSHSSNGYMLKPNKGLNYLLASASYTLPHGQVQPPVAARRTGVSTDSLRAVPNAAFRNNLARFSSHRLWLSFAPSMVQSRWFATQVTVKPKHKYYFAYTAQAGYMYYPNQCLGFGASIDVMYNYSHVEMVEVLYKKDGTMPYLGTSLNFEPRWGIMSIRAGIGYYLVKSEIVDIPVYERLGVFFHFGRRLNHFAGVTIKAHAAHADYIEWHYGIEIFVLGKKSNAADRLLPTASVLDASGM